jgi:hypothetical protein
VRALILAIVMTGCSASRPAPEREPESAFPVRVVYLMPADHERFPEYERAIARVVEEVRVWYLAKTGLTFRPQPLEVIQAKEDYLTMRCGTSADERAKGADRQHMPAWIPSIERAVGGWKPRTATLVFAQGGGGVAQANLQGDFAGWCVVGDWVLEPISGKADPKGITAAMCPKPVYVTGGTPVGTVAHELGHAFGLHHPDGYEGGKRSIMRAHWDYPDTGFLDHEQFVLQTSPFVNKADWDGAAPVAAYVTDDAVEWGAALDVAGHGFKEGDEVEFAGPDRLERVKPRSVAPDKLVVEVPRGTGPGVLRVVRWTVRSNAIPVNVYERMP